MFFYIKFRRNVLFRVWSRLVYNHGNLYPLDGYKPFYNPCMKDKSLGTGVALYIKQSFNSTILDHLCYCTENIETFFMKIHIDDVETCAV